MAVINGREVTGFCFKSEKQLVDKRVRHLLLQHRSKHYHYLVDRLVSVCPDLLHLFDELERVGYRKTLVDIKGRLVGYMMIRYMEYFLNPQQYAFKGDLILHANYVMLVKYLTGKVGRLKHEGIIPQYYYTFKILTPKLYQMSKLWANDMMPLVKDKMIPHYHKLAENEKCDIRS